VNTKKEKLLVEARSMYSNSIVGHHPLVGGKYEEQSMMGWVNKVIPDTESSRLMFQTLPVFSLPPSPGVTVAIHSLPTCLLGAVKERLALPLMEMWL
jgi:hypothetical protein